MRNKSHKTILKVQDRSEIFTISGSRMSYSVAFDNSQPHIEPTVIILNKESEAVRPFCGNVMDARGYPSKDQLGRPVSRLQLLQYCSPDVNLTGVQSNNSKGQLTQHCHIANTRNKDSNKIQSTTASISNKDFGRGTILFVCPQRVNGGMKTGQCASNKAFELDEPEGSH